MYSPAPISPYKSVNNWTEWNAGQGLIAAHGGQTAGSRQQTAGSRQQAAVDKLYDLSECKAGETRIFNSGLSWLLCVHVQQNSKKGSRSKSQRIGRLNKTVQSLAAGRRSSSTFLELERLV